MVSNNFDNNNVNIFVSYSHQDSIVPRIFNKFKNKDKNINFWLDTELGSGEKWDETIVKNVKKCDFFILFISPSILLSEYVFKNELEIIFNRLENEQINNKEQKLIFPYILDFNGDIDTSKTIRTKIDFLLNSTESIKDFEVYRNNLKRLKNFLKENQIDKLKLEFPVNKKGVKKIYQGVIEHLNSILTKDYKNLKDGVDIRKYLKFDEYYAEKIINSVKECNGGTYFNTQIKLTNWFHPALQLNLSLQKEIEEIIDYKSIIKRKKNNTLIEPIVTKTRISRILILPFSIDTIRAWKPTSTLEEDEDEENTTKKIKDNTRYHNLIALNNIHKMMGSPMAVVSYDQLFEMLHFKNRKNENKYYLLDEELDFLGINFKKTQKNEKGERKNITDIDKQIIRLRELIQSQVVEPNKIKESIDFACFSNSEEYKEFTHNYIDKKKSIRTILKDINDEKSKTVIFKAGIDNDTRSNEKKLVFFDFKEVQNYSKFSLKENKLGNILFELKKDKYVDNSYFKASQKFAFLIDHFVFEKKIVNNVNDFDNLDSNKLIYKLNGNGSEYRYKKVIDKHNIKKIFNLV